MFGDTKGSNQCPDASVAEASGRGEDLGAEAKAVDRCERKALLRGRGGMGRESSGAPPAVWFVSVGNLSPCFLCFVPFAPPPCSKTPQGCPQDPFILPSLTST